MVSLQINDRVAATTPLRKKSKLPGYHLKYRLLKMPAEND